MPYNTLVKSVSGGCEVNTNLVWYWCEADVMWTKGTCKGIIKSFIYVQIEITHAYTYREKFKLIIIFIYNVANALCVQLK